MRHSSRLQRLPAALTCLLLAPMALAEFAAPDELGERIMAAQQRARVVAAKSQRPRPAAKHATACVNGSAGGYPCSGIDLYAFVPRATMAAASTNSLWGWTDTTTGTEYALVGVDDGLAFFALEDPTHPRYLGKLPSHTGSSIWRDVRVYADHAFVVSDNNSDHGMQVFDLRRLRGVTAPATWSENAHYGEFGRGHTLAINEQTGFAYVAGSDSCNAPNIDGALHMVDIRDPTSPQFAGCIRTGGYTHETSCWTYRGPDQQHAGREICVNANGASLRFAIVDVSDKSAPVTLSSTAYAGAGYPHQAWLTDDHRFVLLNDEFDETNFGHAARTWVWDVSNLDAPVLAGYHDGELPVIDHNLYVHGEYVYQSNYEAGLRILRMGNLSQAQMTEVAYFDTYPDSDEAEFNGNWNNYRFPGSGAVIATGIDEGLFVLAPRLCTPPPPAQGLTASAAGAGHVALSWTASGSAAGHRIERAQGGCGGTFQAIADIGAGGSFTDLNASGQVSYGYRVVALGEQCSASASACVAATTTGACTAAPAFAGIAQARSAGTSACAVELVWNAASPACGTNVDYSIYRGASEDFRPASRNRVAHGVTGTTFVDRRVDSGAVRHYVVRARDTENGSEEGNLVRLSVAPDGPLADGTFAWTAEPGTPPPATAAHDPKRRGAKHAGWHISGERAHSGARSFWSTRANNLCVSLETPPLRLTDGQLPSLSFWSLWDTEAGWDGGVVEITRDDGASWQRLTPAEGYPAVIGNGGALCGIAVGQRAFTGAGQFQWQRSSVDLGAYVGNTVRLRWLYRTDQSETGEGWFVDDIAVAHAQVPGTCTSPPAPVRPGIRPRPR